MRCKPVLAANDPKALDFAFNSLYKSLADGNGFKEKHFHGARTPVTAPELLASID